jgi:hypothetical protein
MVDILVLVFVPPILYLLLGTVVGILSTVVPTNNLNVKISLIFLLRPIFFVLLLGLIKPFIFVISWMLVLFVFVILRDVFFSGSKFLTGIDVANGEIIINYKDFIFRPGHISVPVSQFDKIKLSQMSSAVDYPANIKLTADEHCTRIMILSKQIWEEADKQLKTVRALG